VLHVSEQDQPLGPIGLSADPVRQEG
jgi:hypothetical protein